MNASAMKTCATVFVLAAVAMITGCDQGPKLVPIEGQVTLDGEPLTYGYVRVIPSGGRPAFGELDEQGRFKLMTDDAEGCPVGSHIVEVGSTKAISETQQKRFAPPKYESGITTDLKIDVKEPKKDVRIELKGDGKKYPYEFRS
jgi:hypothetical protein